MGQIHTVKEIRGFGYGSFTEFFCPYDINGNDVSKNAYPLISYLGAGALSAVQKKFGAQSLHCPASDDGANYGSIAINVTTKDFCIEAWVYPTSTPVYGAVVGKYSTSSGWMMRLNSRRLAWYSYSPNFQIVPGAGQPQAPLNQWSHIAVCKRLSSIVTFMNGGISQSSTVSGVATTADPLIIGMQNGWPGRGFIGYIDNVRVTIGHYRYSAPFTPPNRQY